VPPGYGFRVLEPGATWSVSWWRRALMAAVTVGLIWMCASFVVGSATMLHPADMDPMPASMDLAVGDVEQVASAVPALMAGMCDGVCASVTATTGCSVTAVAAPLTLLGLLLTRRRVSYLGLLPRKPRAFRVRRERFAWGGWSLLSPASLCLWRV